MKCIASFCLLIVFLSGSAFAQLDHPNLLKVFHQSEVLQQEQSYYIYIPSTDDPEERFPVVYMLHGKTQDADAWPRHANAEAFVDGNVRLLFDCEDHPERGLIQQNIKFHEKLSELGVPHIWRKFPGKHNWQYWRAHLQEHLNFHNAAFSEMQEQRKWTQHYFERLSLFLEESAQMEITEHDKDSVIVSLFGSSGIEGISTELLPSTTSDGRPIRFVNRGISSDRLGIDERGLSKRMES